MRPSPPYPNRRLMCVVFVCFVTIPELAVAHDVLILGKTHYLESTAAVNLRVFCGSLAESEISTQTDDVDKIYLSSPRGSKTLEPDSLRPYVTGSIGWRVLQRIKGLLGGRDYRRTSSLVFNPENQGSHALAVRLYDYRLAKTPATYLEGIQEVFQENEPIAKLPEILGRDNLTGSYTKCVKTIIQVGEEATRRHWQA